MQNLIEKLREGVPQMAKRWSGDCGEMSTVDEPATDALLLEAAEAIEKLQQINGDLIRANNRKTQSYRKLEKEKVVKIWFDDWERIELCQEIATLKSRVVTLTQVLNHTSQALNAFREEKAAFYHCKLLPAIQIEQSPQK